MKILIISLFICSNTYSQIDSLALKKSLLIENKKIEIKQTKLKEYLPSAIFVFLAGASDGVRDCSIFYKMQGKGQFWDGSLSFKNKYKNGNIAEGSAYIGSTSFLAFTTDAPHLFNMFTHQLETYSTVFAPFDKNRKFTHLLLKGFVINSIRQIGHYITYDLIY